MTARNRYPSFKGLRPASRASSNAKRANRSTDTAAELQLRTALRRLGLRFQLHHPAVLGRPDIVFVRTRVAIFCDGDFWHGRNWRKLKPQLKSRRNADYWIAKIAANRRRDRQVSRQLQRAGWYVLRFWETEVQSNPDKTALTIAAVIARARSTGTVGQGNHENDENTLSDPA